MATRDDAKVIDVISETPVFPYGFSTTHSRGAQRIIPVRALLNA
jgi:hypothetical protein